MIITQEDKKEHSIEHLECNIDLAPTPKKLQRNEEYQQDQHQHVKISTMGNGENLNFGVKHE